MMKRTDKIHVPRPSQRRLIGAAFTAIVMLAASVARAEEPDPFAAVAPATQATRAYAIVIGTKRKYRTIMLQF